MMTTIKHRNGKILAYHIFTCEISCYYSTMSEDDDIVAMTGNFTREDAEKTVISVIVANSFLKDCL